MLSEGPSGQNSSDVGGKPSRSTDVEAAKPNLIVTMLGEIVSLFMRDRRFRHLSIADLEWAVGPALLLDQVLIARGALEGAKNSDGVRVAGSAVPVGLAIWASVSPSVSSKLEAQLADGVGYRLSPEEWKSGDIPWVLAIVGSPKLRKTMVDKLLSDSLVGAQPRFHTHALGPRRQANEPQTDD